MNANARRTSLLLLLALAATALVAGIIISRRGHTSGAPNVGSADNQSADAAEFVSAAKHALAQLREGMTLAEWTALQVKKEDGARETPSNAKHGCLSLVKTETLPGGRQITRIVSFYPPPAPSLNVLPAASGPELISTTCTLGMIRVETQVSTPEAGHALAQAMHKEFSAKYGPSLDTKRMGFWGAGSWKDAARWMAETEIVSAYDPKVGMAVPDHAPVDTVFVFARLPIVRELEQEACCTISTYHYREFEYAQFHRAVDMSGVDPAVSARMAKLYEEVFMAGAPSHQTQQSSATAWRERFVPVLRDWLSALKTQGPAERAAGLLAADRLLAAVQDIDGAQYGTVNGPYSGPKEAKLRSDLKELGAAFKLSSLGGNYYYLANWLEQARQLDPEGPIGQMALLAAMSRGDCNLAGWNSDPFRKIISEGDILLAKGLDAPTSSRVHFMVGDAYSDIVALAGGAMPDVGDLRKYREEADSARTKALDHYRAGLAVDNTSENAKDAWRQAWHLSAGLLPHTRYACVVD